MHQIRFKNVFKGKELLFAPAVPHVFPRTEQFRTINEYCFCLSVVLTPLKCKRKRLENILSWPACSPGLLLSEPVDRSGAHAPSTSLTSVQDAGQQRIETCSPSQQQLFRRRFPPQGFRACFACVCVASPVCFHSAKGCEIGGLENIQGK